MADITKKLLNNLIEKRTSQYTPLEAAVVFLFDKYPEDAEMAATELAELRQLIQHHKEHHTQYAALETAAREVVKKRDAAHQLGHVHAYDRSVDKLAALLKGGDEKADVHSD